MTTINDRKRTGLSSLGTAIGTAIRSGHCFVMLRISDAKEIHELVRPVMKREQHKIYMRTVRARARALKKKGAIK
jgi:hypothetical protein